MPQKHIKTWMSTDENLVARNQETAEANGLAAAHTRWRSLFLSLPFARPVGTQRRSSLFSRSDAHRDTTTWKTFRDCYIRYPEALLSVS